jgi:hypothetical protein
MPLLLRMSNDTHVFLTAMAQFIPNLGSPRFQLVITAILSGVAGAGLVLGYQALKEEERLSELKNSIPSLEDHQPKRVGLPPCGTRHLRKCVYLL